MEQRADCENLFAGDADRRSLRKLSQTDVEKTERKNKAGFTKLLLLAGISTLFGCSIPVGYTIGVVNAPADIIKQFCYDSIRERYDKEINSSGLKILWSAIVSIFLVGGATGSLSGSWLADRMGRKGALMFSSILLTISAVLFMATKSSNSIEMLIIGRFIVGLASGLITAVMPMYLIELAPVHLSGATGTICPLGVTFGVLFGQVMSLQEVLGTEDAWPYLLGFYEILVVFGAFAYPILPESPKYLYVIKQDHENALKQLMRLRNLNRDELESEIRELKMEQQNKGDESETWNLGKVLTSSKLLLPLLLVCSTQSGQQFSGINAVFYYSVSIFQEAGLSVKGSQLATIGAGIINFAMAVISIYTMSRINRRTLMQLSCGTSAIFLALLGVSITYITTYSWMPYLSVVGVLGYVLTYGIGLGPIPYFIGSELFEVGPRPSAMALGSMANWAGNFIIGMTFPIVNEAIGANSFFIFTAVCILLLIFVRFYLPETRGRDPSETAQIVQNGFKSKPLGSPINSVSSTETNTASNNMI